MRDKDTADVGSNMGVNIHHQVPDDQAQGDVHPHQRRYTDVPTGCVLLGQRNARQVEAAATLGKRIIR